VIACQPVYRLDRRAETRKRLPNEVPGFQNWIEAHRDRYALRKIRTYPGPRGSEVEPVLTYVVCEFVPTPPARAVSTGTDRKVTR
jgi:hypothetical protein